MTAAPPSALLLSGTLEIRDGVRQALSENRALRIVAGGSWLDANRPVLAVGGQNATLAIRAGNIVEYEPGDLTLTARAGVTLDAISRATAAHGQWLALDPPGDPARATIGATVATGSYGPLAHHFGSPRDMTLGVEFVAGTGTIARGGGRVVKNVAGFDLTRLMIGAWGSLGVITEVTVRLRALPAVDVTLVLDVEEGVEQIEKTRRALRAFPFTPLAAQWMSRSLTRHLGIDAPGVVAVVRLGGNEESVRAQRSALEPLGNARRIDGTVWDRLRVAEPDSAASFRLSSKPSEFAATWSYAREILEHWPDAYCQGDAGRGVVRCVVPLGSASDAERLRDVTRVAFRGNRIFERLPAQLWTSMPSSVRTPLEQRIKAAFDPQGILNPGILGELQ